MADKTDKTLHTYTHTRTERQGQDGVARPRFDEENLGQEVKERRTNFPMEQQSKSSRLVSSKVGHPPSSAQQLARSDRSDTWVHTYTHIIKLLRTKDQ